MSRARRVSHGVGSYDREYDYVLTRLEELLAVEDRGRAVLSRYADALATGSASKAFHAKQDVTDVQARVTKALETAEIARRSSGEKLERLPHHEPFTKAHTLIREFDRAIAGAQKMRRRLIDAWSKGDVYSDRDRARRRRRR